jgi:hypothetical protein
MKTIKRIFSKDLLKDLAFSAIFVISFLVFSSLIFSCKKSEIVKPESKVEKPSPLWNGPPKPIINNWGTPIDPDHGGGGGKN